MSRIFLKSFCVLLTVLCSVWPSDACTSVIISSRVAADGRPLMWKNRDTDVLDNSVRHFYGEKYAFTGLVNTDSPGGEVWAGVNTAGFAVMNTASYCLKDDDVPASCMDREGRLMYRALEICASLKDFETFLDTLSRPMGVEANFGCIDAHGGAAWYETDNDSWYKTDVNECPDGYYVVTNFSVTGRPDEWKGVERYITASAMFGELMDEGLISSLTPQGIVDTFSRSYRHDVLGIDLVRDSASFLSHTSGLAVDQDFIPRGSTSASVVIQGVPAGKDPSECVFWAALGYPSCSVTVPVPVSEADHVPASLSGNGVPEDSTFSALSHFLKRTYIFKEEVSNMSRYMDLRPVLAGSGHSEPMLSCCRDADGRISELFLPLWRDYVSGKISEEEYFLSYDRISPSFIDIYRDSFRGYICRPAM